MNFPQWITYRLDPRDVHRAIEAIDTERALRRRFDDGELRMLMHRALGLKPASSARVMKVSRRRLRTRSRLLLLKF